jgi:hypothetical protein
MPTLKEKYSEKLAKRGKESHVYTRFQLIGLEIAQILGDNKHKALYMKLAKEKDSDRLLKIAKDIADKKGIKNKGAYFMAVVKSEEEKLAGQRKK